MLSTYASVPDDEKDGLISALLASEIVRLPSMFLDTYMVGKFAYDVVRGNRDWRK
jgi:hypothetical protein